MSSRAKWRFGAEVIPEFPAKINGTWSFLFVVVIASSQWILDSAREDRISGTYWWPIIDYLFYYQDKFGSTGPLVEHYPVMTVSGTYNILHLQNNPQWMIIVVWTGGTWALQFCQNFSLKSLHLNNWQIGCLIRFARMREAQIGMYRNIYLRW